MSVRLKIIILNSLFIIFICFLLIMNMIFFNNKLSDDFAIDNLKFVVDKNVSLLNSNDGNLVIDKLSFYENNVFLYVYSDDGVLISSYQSDISFSKNNLVDSYIQYDEDSNHSYYIYDVYTDFTDSDNVWVRGVYLLDESIMHNSALLNMIFLSLPLIIFLSIFGTSKIVKKSFTPIDEIIQKLNYIKDTNDLSTRIFLKPSTDEIYKLSLMINNMLDSLNDIFKTEKQFSSDVSHELRTPLSIIISQCEYAILNDDYDNAIIVVKRQCNKMINLINYLLDLTKLDSNMAVVNKKNENLSELLTVVCEDYGILKNRDISLHTDIEDDIFLSIDSDLIIRCLSNLISNAYKYGKDNGNIWISLKCSNNMVILTISDDGIGINSDDISKIFNRFYMADPSRNSCDSSMGLGLSMVLQILNLHYASINVESEFDIGTKFTITF